MAITIKKGSIGAAVVLSRQLPEFTDPYDEQEYKKRLNGSPHLILIAYWDNQPAGFKVGYERHNDGSFYSWLGGVLPEFRQKGIAKKLAKTQEEWAWNQGYKKIRFKTRNRHRNMLRFAIDHAFQIIAVEPEATLEEYRIWMEKDLISPKKEPHAPHIRYYRPEDKNLLTEIFRKNTPVFFAREEEDEWARYIEAHADTYLVLEKDKKLLGAGGYCLSDDPAVGYLTWVFVNPTVKGKGMGRKLMKMCIDRLSNIPSVQSIEVKTSQHAFHFFEKLGFAVVKVKKDYWADGLDLYQMVMSLSPTLSMS